MAISGLLILNRESLARLTVVSQIIHHNIHVTVWVSLRIHLLSYHISCQFNNFTIIKLYQVCSSIENGVVIGSATHLAACIAFAPSDSSFLKSTSTGQHQFCIDICVSHLRCRLKLFKWIISHSFLAVLIFSISLIHRSGMVFREVPCHCRRSKACNYTCNKLASLFFDSRGD